MIRLHEDEKDWRVQACLLLSIAVFVGFLAFAVYAFDTGISKQTIYVGPVGYWLGVYLLIAGAASVLCVLFILWLAATRRQSWRLCAAAFVCAWGTSLLAYAAWEIVVRWRLTAGA